MSNITLTNGFHSTEISVRVPAWMRLEDEDDQKGYWFELQCAAQTDPNAKRTVRRIASKLCGSPDCCCGVVRP